MKIESKERDKLQLFSQRSIRNLTPRDRGWVEQPSENIGRPTILEVALFLIAFGAAVAFAYAIGRQVYESVASGIAVAFFAWVALVLRRYLR